MFSYKSSLSILNPFEIRFEPIRKEKEGYAYLFLCSFYSKQQYQKHLRIERGFLMQILVTNYRRLKFDYSHITEYRLFNIVSL